MAEIHPTAVIAPGAELGAGVHVGPYCIVGPEVVLKDGVHLHSHVVIAGRTEVGDGTEIYPFASIGGPPQDKKFIGEKSRLVIGARNVIREHVTMNLGTEGGGLLTQVGDDGLFMAGAHVAHDCQIGNGIILANHAAVAGHVTVGDFVIIGGLAAVHQFCRIGTHAFIGGASAVTADVIPYGMVQGNRASLDGLNLVGLKRRGTERERIHALRHAYKELFGSGHGTLAERARIMQAANPTPEVQTILDFILSDTDRSICTPKAGQREVA